MKYNEKYKQVCDIFLSNQTNDSRTYKKCDLCNNPYVNVPRGIVLCKRCHDYSAFLFAQNVSRNDYSQMDQYDR
jgi:hypothetical protein